MLQFVTTSDGSKTLFNTQVGENYHSKHGALQESQHVFLDSGMRHFIESNNASQVHILEVGFGTGLNFLVTAAHCMEHAIKLKYTGIEAFPLSAQMLSQTGYEEYIPPSLWHVFNQAYPLALEKNVAINELTELAISNCTVRDFRSQQTFDVIYFDAFAAVHQPEMWAYDTLAHICSFLNPGGIFVTYAITGDLKRNMKLLGFSIEKAPGASGKREMLRATKNIRTVS